MYNNTFHNSVVKRVKLSAVSFISQPALANMCIAFSFFRNKVLLWLYIDITKLYPILFFSPQSCSLGINLTCTYWNNFPNHFPIGDDINLGHNHNSDSKHFDHICLFYMSLYPAQKKKNCCFFH